jgi:hypothetical protein
MRSVSAHILLITAIATLLTASRSQPVSAAVATLRCTNPYSGAMWDLTIDYDRSLADAFPAEITQTRISWRDTSHGGNYLFDRRSGTLTVTYPSSTGGFSLRDKCEFP